MHGRSTADTARSPQGPSMPNVRGSRFGVDDDVLHVRLAVADVVLQAAGEIVRGRQRHVGGYRHGDEHDQAAVGVQKPQVSRRVSGVVAYEASDALTLEFVG